MCLIIYGTSFYSSSTKYRHQPNLAIELKQLISLKKSSS